VSRRTAGWSQVTCLQALTNPLRIDYPFLTGKGVISIHGALRVALGRMQRARERKGGIASMTIEIHEQTLWLIPVSLAVGFMVWVLWNWWREEHPKKESRIEIRRADEPHPRVINLPAEPAASSEARDWRKRGKLILL
jgi:hypothetical protein